MLVLTRKRGESIKIYPADTLRPNARVQDFFSTGPIDVLVVRISRKEVKLAVRAHPDLVILRHELNAHIEK